MPYKENLNRAKALKAELDTFRPLTPEIEKRIMQKFRLDWNYHSSHIEGNSLTYGETRALILFGQTAQAKPLKDHLEMSGHDEAIKNIEDIVKQKRPLTESFIRELHILILKEPYEVDAITPDGKPIKKIVQIGKYKTTPNHVKTVTGEIFYFASPEETSAKMQDLMIWYNENLNKPETDPALFASEFQYRFIRIHPFDDGNGRISRLLMNFILMQKGYPPAIIKTEDKQNYFNALQQADVGHIEYFFNYICEQVIHSLELMIKGAKGEYIEGPDDFEKKLALLKTEIELSDSEEYDEERNPKNMILLAENLIIPLFEALIIKLKELESLFTNSIKIVIYDIYKDKILENHELSFLKVWIEAHPNGKKIQLIMSFKELIKARPENISVNIGIDIYFEKYYYEMNESFTSSYYKKSYNSYLSKEEQSKLISEVGSKLLSEIEEKWTKIKEQRNKTKKGKG